MICHRMYETINEVYRLVDFSVIFMIIHKSSSNDYLLLKAV